jgi:hypothetical protein
VNHVAVEDAQAALDVIFGMILVNDNNTIVLFDSRASHSFIATNFVWKHNLPLSMPKNRMIASSPGGDMNARHVSPTVLSYFLIDTMFSHFSLLQCLVIFQLL